MERCGQVTYKSGDNQSGVTYKLLILSHLTYKSGDLLKPNTPWAVTGQRPWAFEDLDLPHPALDALILFGSPFSCLDFLALFDQGSQSRMKIHWFPSFDRVRFTYFALALLDRWDDI